MQVYVAYCLLSHPAGVTDGQAIVQEFALGDIDISPLIGDLIEVPKAAEFLIEATLRVVKRTWVAPEDEGEWMLELTCTDANPSATKDAWQDWLEENPVPAPVR